MATSLLKFHFKVDTTVNLLVQRHYIFGHNEITKLKCEHVNKNCFLNINVYLNLNKKYNI